MPKDEYAFAFDVESELLDDNIRLRNEIKEVQTQVLKFIIDTIKECSNNYVIFPENKKYYETDVLLNKIFERYPYMKNE